MSVLCNPSPPSNTTVRKRYRHESWVCTGILRVSGPVPTTGKSSVAQTFSIYITQFQSGIFRKYVLEETNEDPAHPENPCAGVVKCAVVSNDPFYRLIIFDFV